MAKFKVGDIVKVIENTNGHNYQVGEVYKVEVSAGGDQWTLRHLKTSKLGNYITENELEFALRTRVEIAEHLKTGVLPEKEAALEALKKEVEDLKAKIERYERFDSVEAEAAHLISQIFKTGGDPGAILEVLKTTKVLSGKEDF